MSPPPPIPEARPPGYLCLDRMEPLLRAGTGTELQQGLVRLEMSRANQGVDNGLFDSFEQALKFDVVSERLAPPEVEFRFPPPDAMHDFANVLPHVVLKNPTLPWERTAQKDEPWLALLVLQTATVEIKEGQVKDMLNKEKKVKDELGEQMEKSFSLRPPETDTSLCRYVDLKADQIAKLPELGQLNALAHVQEVVHNDGTRQAMSVVISKESVEAEGVYQVLLVSVEGRGAVLRSKAARFCVLDAWTFTHKKSDKGTGAFTDLLMKVKTKATTASVVKQVLKLGIGESRALYAGPLQTQLPAAPAKSFPLRDSEQALLFNAKSEETPFDITYAAAWELGRLIGLQNKVLGFGLARWRLTRKSAAEPLPEAVREEFKRLGQLEGVPLHYLLAPEALPGNEEISFFRIDPLWIRFLIDGAFSIGRHSEQDFETDKEYLAELWKADSPQFVDVFGGSALLLRSEAVRNWPRLEAFSNEEQADKSSTALRQQTFGTDLLLCIFDDAAESFTLGLPVDAPHFEAAPGMFKNNPGGHEFAQRTLKIQAAVRFNSEKS